MLLETHLREQECARAYYYLSQALSIHRPMQVLCIMHDKMDHSKTASPCFTSKTKSVDAYLKLPVSVVGMIAHGHGDKKYAHYSLDLYPADSNCTIGSIARLLRDLERPPKYSNPESLFRGTGTTDLYAAVLWGCEDCINSILAKHSIQEQFVSLPPIPGLSRVRTSTSASAGRSDASDNPTDVRRTACRPPLYLADGMAYSHPTAGRPLRPSVGWRMAAPSAGRGGGRPGGRPGGPLRLGRPPKAVRHGPSARAVRPAKTLESHNY
jgi:hypothetical protein